MKLKSHSLIDETQISFIDCSNYYSILQIYLRIQVKSEILTTQINQVVSLFEIRNLHLKYYLIAQTYQIINSYSNHKNKQQINHEIISLFLMRLIVNRFKQFPSESIYGVNTISFLHSFRFFELHLVITDKYLMFTNSSK